MLNVRGQLSGFQKFVLRGNVVDLAVGFVVGAAFAAVVQALVKGFINPLIGLFGGVPDLSSMVFTVRNSQFLVGDFISVLLNFLVVAVIVYFFVVVPINRLRDRFETAPVPTRECPECLSKVPRAARRCAFCASPLTPDPSV
jgi:large conductance mechanosensitive channel